MRERPMNKLHYGDNLGVLRKYIADESIDLAYGPSEWLNSVLDALWLVGHSRGG
jgi:hypothetical protein